MIYQHKSTNDRHSAMLAEAAMVRNQLKVYSSVAAPEWLDRQSPLRLRKWLKEAKTALRLVQPAVRTMARYTTRSGLSAHDYIWAIPNVRLHTQVGRTVAEVSKSGLMVRNRPMFKHHSPLHEGHLLCANGPATGTAAQAASVIIDKGVPFSEYHCVLPGGLRPLRISKTLSKTTTLGEIEVYNNKYVTRNTNTRVARPRKVMKTMPPRPSLKRKAKQVQSAAVMFGQPLKVAKEKMALAVRKKRRLESAAQQNTLKKTQTRLRVTEELKSSMANMLVPVPLPSERAGPDAQPGSGGCVGTGGSGSGIGSRKETDKEPLPSEGAGPDAQPGSGGCGEAGGSGSGSGAGEGPGGGGVGLRQLSCLGPRKPPGRRKKKQKDGMKRKNSRHSPVLVTARKVARPATSAVVVTATLITKSTPKRGRGSSEMERKLEADAGGIPNANARVIGKLTRKKHNISDEHIES